MMELLIIIAGLYILLGYGIVYDLPDPVFRGRFLFQEEGSWKATLLLVFWPYDLIQAFRAQKEHKHHFFSSKTSHC